MSMPLPPLNLNATSRADSGNGGGNAWALGGADWVVNLGGSGQAMPSSIPWLWIIAGAAAWVILKK